VILERCTVSRKTPLDGKVEITAPTAGHLRVLGDDFPISHAGHLGLAHLESLACTCAKAGGSGHTHHFIQSDLLRALIPGAVVVLVLDERNEAVSVE
jgi:hypothetical protein